MSSRTVLTSALFATLFISGCKKQPIDASDTKFTANANAENILLVVGVPDDLPGIDLDIINLITGLQSADQNGQIGFSEIRTHWETGKQANFPAHNNARKDVILGSLADAASRVGPQGSVYLYFTGHGVDSQTMANIMAQTGQPLDSKFNQNLLVENSNPANPADPSRFLSAAEILDAVESTGGEVGRLGMIIDACYSGELLANAVDRLDQSMFALQDEETLPDPNNQGGGRFGDFQDEFMGPTPGQQQATNSQTGTLGQNGTAAQTNTENTGSVFVDPLTGEPDPFANAGTNPGSLGTGNNIGVDPLAGARTSTQTGTQGTAGTGSNGNIFVDPLTGEPDPFANTGQMTGTTINNTAPLGAGTLGSGNLGAGMNAGNQGRFGSYLAPSNIKSRMFFTTSRDVETSDATAQGSVFTLALSQALQQIANTGDQSITIAQLFQSATDMTSSYHQPVCDVAPLALFDEPLLKTPGYIAPTDPNAMSQYAPTCYKANARDTGQGTSSATGSIPFGQAAAQGSAQQDGFASQQQIQEAAEEAMNRQMQDPLAQTGATELQGTQGATTQTP